jgi:hypothetical protein
MLAFELPLAHHYGPGPPGLRFGRARTSRRSPLCAPGKRDLASEVDQDHVGLGVEADEDAALEAFTGRRNCVAAACWQAFVREPHLTVSIDR